MTVGYLFLIFTRHVSNKKILFVHDFHDPEAFTFRLKFFLSLFFNKTNEIHNKSLTQTLMIKLKNSYNFIYSQAKSFAFFFSSN